MKEEFVVGTSQLSRKQETIFMAMLVSLEMKNEESDEGNLSDQKVNWVEIFMYSVRYQQLFTFIMET